MVFATLPLLLALQAPAGGGCSFALPAEAEQPRLAAAARAAGESLNRAAASLCAAGVLTREDLAGFERLLVRDGEAAIEPLVYDDVEQAPGALILEYGFGAAARPPADAAVRAALHCWREPERDGCYEDSD